MCQLKAIYKKVWQPQWVWAVQINFHKKCLTVQVSNIQCVQSYNSYILHLEKWSKIMVQRSFEPSKDSKLFVFLNKKWSYNQQTLEGS